MSENEKKEFPKWVALDGVIEWAKVFASNRDKRGPNDAYVGWDGATTVDMLLSDGEYQKLKDAGSTLTGKKEGDNWRVKFKRRWVHRTSKGEEYPQYGGAPNVIRPDGTPWDLTEDGLIGNGSTGICHVQIYQSGSFLGTRLVGLQVRDHVAFESTGSGFSYPDLTQEGSPPKEEPKAKKQMVDDEIPF